METTFIAIHDLSRDVRIKFASQAVEDVIGFQPEEVANRPVWDFLDPQEIPLAEDALMQIISYERTAIVSYFNIRHKEGHWVRCEIVTTVAYNVLVSTMKVYQRGPSSQKRAADGPVVSKLFTSMKDPEYHMLSDIAGDYSPTPYVGPHEQRAAIILNRFTRSSSVMYATSATSSVLGVTPAQLLSKSFYYCVEECCLHQAVQCIEGSKASGSVAYLRFWLRNPLQGEHLDFGEAAEPPPRPNDCHCCSGDDGDDDDDDDDEEFDEAYASGSSGSSSPSCCCPSRRTSNLRLNARREVEAVVSCSSDGIIVILRRARAPAPGFLQHFGHPVYANQQQSSGYTPTALQCSEKACAGPSMSSSAAGGPHPEVLKSSIREAALLAMKGQR